MSDITLKMCYTDCEKNGEHEQGVGAEHLKEHSGHENLLDGIVTKIYQEWAIKWIIFRPIITAQKLLVVVKV